MEIIVEGKSTKIFQPDEVMMNANFLITAKMYEEVLEKGNYNVQMFINELNKLGFASNDIKTKNFVIREERKYNDEIGNYDFVGYSYNQNVKLVFDYAVDKLSKIMNSMINLESAPTYEFVFRLKDNNSYQNMLLDAVYNDALNQAESISKKFDKTLKECLKTEFKVYDNNLSRLSSVVNFGNVIVPDDIEVSATLYCTWLAE